MTTPANHLNILVVDGSELVLDRIRTLLKELNGVDRISTAHGYSEALDILSAQRQDIVLLELTLQEKSGFDLLAFIKQHHPDIKTIILTNLSGEVYQARCMKMGADFFIDKSREFEKIIRIISQDIPATYQLN